MRLRRLLGIVAVTGLVLGALIGIAARGDDGGSGYLVRAVFDNGSFVIPGEDVKVAGVKVGSIKSVDLTRDNRAAVVLQVDDAAFTPFRSDAHCQIRLQSLIGEQFVDCQPSAQRDPEAAPKPALALIRKGDGKGQHLLPVDNTTTPVPVDLLNDIARQPQRQRLRLLINELGAGLAGNGTRLRAAVRRANPALKQLQDVSATLAGQSKLLGDLTRQSDRVLKPLAERRRELAGFIDHSGRLGVATAERGDALEANIAKLPAFLRELPRTADSFSAFADQASPALGTLQRNAPAINEAITRFGPFSKAATPALQSLGDTADRGRKIFPAIRPLVGDLRNFTRPLRPLSRNLASLSGSFDKTGGIEDLMRLIYFYTGATNGVDSQGHFTRTLVNATSCLDRTPVQSAGNCLGSFDPDNQAAISGAKAAPRFTQPDTFGRDSVDSDAQRYGVDLSQSSSLLDFLFGPGSGTPLPQTDAEGASTAAGNAAALGAATAKERP